MKMLLSSVSKPLSFYVNKLQESELAEYIEIFDDCGGIVIIDIQTIEMLKRLNEIVGNELIFDVETFSPVKYCAKIKIYDGYVE